MAELQDVFSRHWAGYAGSRSPTCSQSKAAEAIMACRTSSLGGHVDACDECGHTRPSYNSCRNRHCPKCQGVRSEQWVQRRVGDLLAVPYFHVVFTVPDTLHGLFLSNDRAAYQALFRASADTLLECAADGRFLGARAGFTSVLHTSGQNLAYHPHIHAIVCAAGLDGDGGLRVGKGGFFVPVKVLSRVFRGKLLAALKGLPLTIRGEDDPKRVADMISASWEREWVVYAKEPFSGPARVVEYLGRYTHKTAISNARILEVGDEKVSFRWRDYRDGDKWKVMALDAGEFIRRFLMHVLPPGFMRIRHYGFLANNGKCARVTALKALCGMALAGKAEATGLEIACRLAGRDITACPECGSPLRRRPLQVLLC